MNVPRWKATVVAFVLISISGSRGAPAQPPVQKLPQVQPLGAKKTGDTTTAREIAHAYLFNAALADDKYTEKRLVVTGRLMRITGSAYVKWDGVPGTIYGLEMAAEEPMSDLYLYFRFDDADRKVLAKLKENNLVTVEALCKGLAPAKQECVYFWECKVIAAGK